MKKSLFLFIIVLAITLPVMERHACYANSAEPPSVIIIVPNAPKDLTITLLPGNVEGRRTDKLIESYFSFYSYELKSSNYTLLITTGAGSFEIILEAPLQRYENLYTLDLKNRTLTPGKSLSLAIAVPAIRIVLTLAIEGFVFFIFGYRSKRSWVVFLVVNLITQAFLNIFLAGNTNPLNNYIIFSLVFAEFIIFIIEMIAFVALLKERGRLRAVFYVLAANFLSLVVGSYLIAVLPV